MHQLVNKQNFDNIKMRGTNVKIICVLTRLSNGPNISDCKWCWY